jgi:hypothetical protein
VSPGESSAAVQEDLYASLAEFSTVLTGLRAISVEALIVLNAGNYIPAPIFANDDFLSIRLQ